jgi:hypothetical protein
VLLATSQTYSSLASTSWLGGGGGSHWTTCPANDISQPRIKNVVWLTRWLILHPKTTRFLLCRNLPHSSEQEGVSATFKTLQPTCTTLSVCDWGSGDTELSSGRSDFPQPLQEKSVILSRSKTHIKRLFFMYLYWVMSPLTSLTSSPCNNTRASSKCTGSYQTRSTCAIYVSRQGRKEAHRCPDNRDTRVSASHLLDYLVRIKY